MTTHLEELERITPILQAFPTVIDDQSGFKEHRMTCGTSFSWGLDSRPEGSCARWFNSAGTEFPEHTHAEREWIIILKGVMFLKLLDEDRELELSAGDWYVLEAGENHGGRFLEDCLYYAITIPRSPDWPTNK